MGLTKVWTVKPRVHKSCERDPIAALWSSLSQPIYFKDLIIGQFAGVDSTEFQSTVSCRRLWRIRFRWRLWFWSCRRGDIQRDSFLVPPGRSQGSAQAAKIELER